MTESILANALILVMLLGILLFCLWALFGELLTMLWCKVFGYEYKCIRVSGGEVVEIHKKKKENK